MPITSLPLHPHADLHRKAVHLVRATNGDVSSDILSPLALERGATACRISQALLKLREQDPATAGRVERRINAMIHQSRGAMPRDWQPVWPS